MNQRKQTKGDLVTNLIAFESGELNAPQTIELFSSLIKSGMAWQLQGCYERGARNLILQGYLDNKGDITCNLDEL